MVVIYKEGGSPFSDEKTLRELVVHTCFNAGMKGDVALVFVGEERGAELNSEYRGREGATNVLSFPSLDGTLGDVVITTSIVQKEAAQFERSYQEHEQRLIIHGLLHLAGYVHDTEEEATTMKRREEDLYTSFYRK